jgi:hypothetical protein
MALIVREQPRAIISERWLHGFLEDFFGLEEVTVAIDDHQ